MKLLSILLLLSLILSITASPALADPQSTHYMLRDYSFGAGGGESSSTNYKAFGILGGLNFNGSSTNYKIGGGQASTINASVPPAPSIVDQNSSPNKLHIILDTGGNPTDTLFAIAISTDGFATNTSYVQADQTIGTSPVWQDYTTWGSSNGFDVIGLNPNTTYTVKVSAKQGNYSQSAWGPTVSTATAQVSLSFDIDVAPTNIQTDPPYEVDFGTLTMGQVSTASDKIWISMDTNAPNGGSVYVYDQYGGLHSSATNYTISSTTSNLDSDSEGFGMQASPVSQTSGGPIEASSLYNTSGDSVGTVDGTIREIFNTSDNPIAGGRGSIDLKIKTSDTTPASSDYADSLTFIASGVF